MIHAAAGSAHRFIQSSVSSDAPLTLFCDFDGPIVDVSERYYQTYQLGLAEIKSVYQRQGIAPRLNELTKERFWQMKQERTPDVEIAMRSGLRGHQIEQFLDRVKQIVNQPKLLHQDQIQPGVKWALALLHSQGVRLVLVTLRQQNQAAQILREHELESLFSQIWGTQDEDVAYLNQSEHKIRLLQTAMSHCAPTAAWMVGDTEADILAGQASSIPTIALTCGIRSRTYLQKFQPTRIHADLLSAAHFLTDSAQHSAQTVA
ncbi:HAD family hydrolase [Leptolyngbya sp. NK1-12]|uniref:HAD family hydrolase n=1 Tax=Leptolyngbya sp. NK1-12 TaxID=2547451 RepID=A0AA96WCG7_9CYAN|nr:HAD family hydrolase [Leptolyngbya sp. NK1-12]WNZ23767.1 HAD family hydrolase [Leptolyngbya sp. NK1-12]